MPLTTLTIEGASAGFETAVRRFEAEWRGSGRPDLDRHLTTGADRPRLLVELIHIDLDFRLRAGDSARVEEYLNRFPELAEQRDAVLDLIADEYVLRRRWRGEVPADDYPARFPTLAGALRSRLEKADRQASTFARPRWVTSAPPDIPGYQLLGELGRGGMGVVYEARQLAAGRKVAVKTLLPGLPPDDVYTRFRREAEAMARLDHPHIVPVYEVGEAGGVPFFSMKLYPGGSLGHRPRPAALDPAADARLVETVARAVHHAHQRGVLHRDLKPTNILLDEAGEPHIADFGLAKRFDPAAETALDTAVVGTPSYIAPELARGDRAVTTATDVYGLGAVLYELLTGTPPFLADTPLATLAAVAEQEPQRPRLLNPSVPADLETVCLKCLAKEPGQRYPSAEALADDLRRWRAGEPIGVRPLGPVAGAVRWAKRRPREAAIVALVFALLLATAGGVWALDRQATRQHAERESRRQLAEARVRAAVAHMPGLRERFQWAAAADTLERARQEADEFGLEELRAEVDDARREMTLAARVDVILLDRVIAADDPDRGWPAAVRAYCEAMREFGLDLEEGDEAEVIGRVKGSPSREQLVAGLNVCAYAGHAGADKLKRVAKAAEPDVWREFLGGTPTGRSPAERRAELKARVAKADPARLTPLLLARIGPMLGADDALDLLRAAQLRRPGDFWFNLTLGNTLHKMGRAEEAARFLQVALAVRPDCGVAYHQLGHCLRSAGRTGEAVVCHQQAVRLDPHKEKFRKALEEAEKLTGER
jgi:tetratricopeptide (TPR) repeat protein